MRHRHGYRTLCRKSAHRKAMFRNMATSFIKEERINTTLHKAKELRGYVERLITMGKRGDLHARRQAASFLFDKESVRKLFGPVAERMKDRPGGYTRIYRTGVRFGDGAKLAIIELVDYGDETLKDSKKKEKAEKKRERAEQKAKKKEEEAAMQPPV